MPAETASAAASATPTRKTPVKERPLSTASPVITVPQSPQTETVQSGSVQPESVEDSRSKAEKIREHFLDLSTRQSSFSSFTPLPEQTENIVVKNAIDSQRFRKPARTDDTEEKKKVHSMVSMFECKSLLLLSSLSILEYPSPFVNRINNNNNNNNK